MPCTRGQIPCCSRMTDAVECLETHNEHSASALRALPLGMRSRNLAYSEQAGPSPLKFPMKWCKSTVRQESPAQSASDKSQIRPVSNGSLGFEITCLILCQIPLRSIFLPMMFNMTGVTGALAGLAFRPTQPPHIPHVMQFVALLSCEMHGGA